jgi:hypothetical protein
MAIANKTSKRISSVGTTDIIATDFNPLEIINVVFCQGILSFGF